MSENAVEELKFLLDRGYRREYALQFVGDHHMLGKRERNRLLREVYSDDEIEHTTQKLQPINAIRDKAVAVDGFNVLITVETGLAGGEVYTCQDGLLRDNAMAFGNYKITDGTENAVNAAVKALAEHQPKHVTWVFDSQISGSGKLAEYVRRKMVEAGLKEDCTTCPAADGRILKMNTLTATSDTALIRRLDSIFDLAAAALDVND